MNVLLEDLGDSRRDGMKWRGSDRYQSEKGEEKRKGEACSDICLHPIPF